ncbi:hypothetical protein [Priestia koreensis]|uniref:hypothetical protein n=1 Tax=Priestia koreensis TaxID=284581 RepID=UPI0028F73218|nr:hypothetical protein [Priestia koreensis]
MKNLTFHAIDLPSTLQKSGKIQKVYAGRTNNLIYLIEDDKKDLFILYTYNEEKITLPPHIPDSQAIINIQEIGTNDWLIAYRQEDEDIVCICSGFGKVLTEFSIGEGVEDCQVDIKDQIWVSYFDEGIFSEDPRSQEGIVAFDLAGNVVYDRYGKLVVDEIVPPIDDCYALNVTGDEVWLYYYSDFPVVQLKNHQLENIWKDIDLDPYSVHSFAVGTDHLIFCTNKGPLLHYSLINNKLEQCVPTDENGKALRVERYVCRGPIIYLHTLQGIYTYKLT